jgi:hypothetical protein
MAERSALCFHPTLTGMNGVGCGALPGLPIRACIAIL